MAKLTKTAARKPLADANLMFSANFKPESGKDAYGVRIVIEGERTESNRGRYYSLDLDRAETIRLIKWAAQVTNRKFDNGVDVRKPWEALRDLADRLEQEATGETNQ